LQLIQQVSAVTAAVLAIRKCVFLEVGGFDEEAFAVSYNDVDLCLRLQQKGYRNIYSPDAVLYHHESRSRGEPSTPAEYEQWQRERSIMIQRWGSLLLADPFYSPYLSLHEENFSIWLETPSSLQVSGRTAP
jgi:GT2 family glycosyltransferase